MTSKRTQHARLTLSICRLMAEALTSSTSERTRRTRCKMRYTEGDKTFARILKRLDMGCGYRFGMHPCSSVMSTSCDRHSVLNTHKQLMQIICFAGGCCFCRVGPMIVVSYSCSAVATGVLSVDALLFQFSCKTSHRSSLLVAQMPRYTHNTGSLVVQ